MTNPPERPGQSATAGERPAPLVRRGYDRGIATLTLDSPHNRNALSSRLVTELLAGLEAAANDPATRAVLLDHTGSTFCAGADLSEAVSGATADGGAPVAGPLGLARLMRTVVELPVPVVARVTGHVRAGGLGLLGACDISAAGPAASFAFTEARLGLAPAVISMPLLPRLDPRAAGRYYLTGERFDAAEAARIGLITLAGDPDDVLVPVLDGLRRGSPQGLAESKRLVTAEVLRAFDRDTAALAELSARLFGSAEAREGMTAFLERRDPAWAPTPATTASTANPASTATPATTVPANPADIATTATPAKAAPSDGGPHAARPAEPSTVEEPR
ncbi:enoyl-CoA hydratase family protein [Streptomyces sp. 71268]|uniref:enoyl-CoA hydratase family protein n=1 Tax=Streptomyces sp. 71268 TaxID=3002640 RepID=UPI0023F68A88|nr:enoyl-CoA hydratase family protein [Streptomyces sp. 71268]WEV27220.1 enoyl-CoA hydratase family protein [Streptomyces sp. 71268]